MINGVNGSSVLRVSYLPPTQEQEILTYLQGAVYCWCNNKKDDWFCIGSFAGDLNEDWIGTPLIILYDHYIILGESGTDAYNHAAQDSGTLLKLFLHRDSRTYDMQNNGQRNEYKFVNL
jgi:hypothetical protein